jgi:iron-sulfur cluster assembly accessory protein
MINLTESAVGAVRRFIDSSEKNIVGLRIKVEGGGCSGLKYGMKLEETLESDDSVVDFPGVKVVIDPTAGLFCEVLLMRGFTCRYVPLSIHAPPKIPLPRRGGRHSLTGWLLFDASIPRKPPHPYGAPLQRRGIKPTQHQNPSSNYKIPKHLN